MFWSKSGLHQQIIVCSVLSLSHFSFLVLLYLLFGIRISLRICRRQWSWIWDCRVRAIFFFFLILSKTKIRNRFILSKFQNTTISKTMSTYGWQTNYTIQHILFVYEMAMGIWRRTLSDQAVCTMYTFCEFLSFES